MAVFESPYHDDHEMVVFGRDPASGLMAIVAIHSTVLGPALGGCRMYPYPGEQDAIDDVLRLSRGMTYKAAVAGLDFGGGKAVIIGDPARDKSPALLRAAGRLVDRLGGRYVTAEDVGTTVADMDVLREVTAHARGVSDATGNPSPATAWGVFAGIREAVRHRLGRQDLAGVVVAVQGVGNVGYRLCRYLAEAGARLVVADVNGAAAARAAADFDAGVTSAEAVHREPADVFAPCAMGGVLHDTSIAELAAQVVAGSANNQLAEDRHGEALKDRGILYAPDYVINAGGLIDIAHEGPDYSRDRVLAQVGRIGDTLAEIFRTAEAEGVATGRVADRMARERLDRAAAGRRAA